MSLTLKLYIGFIFHLIGDYITQTDYVARNKIESTRVALLHALVYSLPFLFLLNPLPWFLFVLAPHFFIDRFRLALYVIRVKNWCFTDTGFPEATPAWLTTFLLFVVDNTLHLITNSAGIIFDHFHNLFL